MRRERETWVGIVATLALLAGCQPDLLGETSDRGSDDGSSTAADDAWSLCDETLLPEPPADAIACPGGVPTGELGADQANAIFGRMTHEVGHLVALVREGADEAGLLERDGDEIRAGLDVGYVLGAIATDATTAKSCVAVELACWTGGHGGWGQSALDGKIEVRIEGDRVEVVGDLGLTEGGALSGAPAAQVWARIDAASVEGSVGAYGF